MKSGKAPQLPLEAFIVTSGGFPGFSADLVPQALEVIKVTGKAAGVAETSFDGTKDLSLEALIADTQARTRALLTRFDHPGTPYRARIGTAKDMRYDDTLHLARVQEWGLPGDGEESGA
jgi:ATP-dependent helicase/nuclease subunit B